MKERIIDYCAIRILTRDRLHESLHKSLSPNDRQFILNFKKGTPNWEYLDFNKFPAIQWKLQNILNLKINNPEKHAMLLKRLEDKIMK